MAEKNSLPELELSSIKSSPTMKRRKWKDLQEDTVMQEPETGAQLKRCSKTKEGDGGYVITLIKQDGGKHFQERLNQALSISGDAMGTTRITDSRDQSLFMQPSRNDVTFDLNQSSIFGGLANESLLGLTSPIEVDSGLEYHDQEINEHDTDNDILIKLYRKEFLKWKIKNQPDEKYDFTFGGNEQDSDDDSNCSDSNYINLNNRMPSESPPYSVQLFEYEPELQAEFNLQFEDPQPDLSVINDHHMRADQLLIDGGLIFE